MSANSRKAYLVITCTFLLGLFLGLIISSLVWRRAQPSGPNPRAIVDELATELSLSDEQRQQVEKILAETRQQFQDLRKQFRPQMMQIRDSSRERIGALLTPQQKAEFDQLNQRQDSKREHHRGDDSKK